MNAKQLMVIMICALLVALAGCKMKQDPSTAPAVLGESPAAVPATTTDSGSAALPPETVAPPSQPSAGGSTAAAPATPDTAGSTQLYTPPTGAQGTLAQPATPSTTTGAFAPSGSYRDAKVAKLVAKARVADNYVFLYQTSENWDVLRDRYFIYKDRMKIDLYDVNLYNKKSYFDMVYLDTAKKSGVAYCEDRKHMRCVDPDRVFEIGFDDFIIRTPKDWMASLPTDAKVVGSETFDKRLSDVIEYPRPDGAIVRMWVDSFSGLPSQIVIYLGEKDNLLERYGFRDLSVNSVKLADVMHQT